MKRTNETHHGKTNKEACAPKEDSDQPGQLLNLESVFAICMEQQRLCLDWAGCACDCWFGYFINWLMRFAVPCLFTSYISSINSYLLKHLDILYE